jgi:hypothetical protein
MPRAVADNQRCPTHLAEHVFEVFVNHKPKQSVNIAIRGQPLGSGSHIICKHLRKLVGYLHLPEEPNTRENLLDQNAFPSGNTREGGNPSRES